MGDLITDEMLNRFGIMGQPDIIVPELKKRYGDFTARTDGSFAFVDAETRAQMVADLRA